MEAYLGLVNFFRDLIPLYSRIAAPLESMRKMQVIADSEWTDRRHNAFLMLKDVIAAGLFLSFPDYDRKFHVASDASRAGLGAALYQLKDESKADTVSNRRYILFAARALHKSERNYSATKLELDGMVFALKKFHYYLWGRHFHLYIDHRALMFLFTQKTISPLMAGWIDVLLSYSFSVHHRPGVLNILPDHLSRLFEQYGITNEQCVYSVRCFRSDAHPADACLQQQEPATQTNDPVPEDKRAEELQRSHLRGHFGEKAMLRDLLHRGCFWPSIRSDIANHVSSCQSCQRFTISLKGYHPLTPIVAAAPMDAISIDLSLAFPTSPRGNNILLVVVCRFSRFVLLRALPDKAAATVAVALFEIFCDFGFPRIICSDNGSEFVNQLMQVMVQTCGIDHRLSTKYHPRGNGLAERFVSISTRAIKKLLDGEDTAWDLHHRAVQYFMNCKIAELHQSAPFSVMFVRRMNEFADFSSDSVATPYGYEQAKARFSFASDVLYPALRDRQSGQASKAIRSFAKHNRILKEPFPNGSYVMVIDPRRSKKTEPFYLGPFKVLRRNRGGAYLLLDTDGSLFHRSVAPSQLKLVSKDPKHDALSFVVDHIVSHRGPASRREYLVRWKSMPKSEDSWEPASNFDDTACIRRYWESRSSNSGGGNVVPPPSSTLPTSSTTAVSPTTSPTTNVAESQSSFLASSLSSSSDVVSSNDSPLEATPVAVSSQARAHASLSLAASSSTSSQASLSRRRRFKPVDRGFFVDTF